MEVRLQCWVATCADVQVMLKGEAMERKGEAVDGRDGERMKGKEGETMGV